MNDDPVRCEHCDGDGEWWSECCSGAGGCDCHGRQINMGRCQVCGGTGYRRPEANRDANRRMIQGQCFIGSGPSSGYWRGK